MGQKITLQNSIDTWISPDRDKGRVGDTRLYAHSTANSYHYFARPKLPTGSIIVSAKLRLFPDTTSGGSGTVDVSLHNTTSMIDSNILTWANQPGVSTLIQTLTRASWFSSGLPIEFDVTSRIQSIVNGATDWFGWRVSSTEVDPNQSYGGMNSTAPPQLEIEYNVPPSPPTDLIPNTNAIVRDPKPTLYWTTPGGNVSQQLAIQIQVATNAAFTTGLWTSAEIPTGAYSFDLDFAPIPLFTALTSGQTRWWRIRIKNETGQWSAYSTGAQFTYQTAQTLTITAPAASTNDPTPTVAWTYGGTQIAWQMLVDVQEGAGSPNPYWAPMWDSGFQYTSVTSFELPVGIVVSDTKNYRVTLRVWDTGEQVSLAGAPVHSEATKIWNWDPTGAVPPVDIRLDDVLVGRPGKYVRWRYTGPTASRFLIWTVRNGKEDWWYVDAATAREGVTEWYNYPLFPVGRADVTYAVNVVRPDGVAAAWSECPSITKRVNHKMPWITSIYDWNRCFSLMNPEIDPGLSEVSDLVQPAGGAPHLVVWAYNKFNGTARGIISNEALPGIITAQQMLEHFMWIRQQPRVHFVWADQSIQALIYNTAFTPIPRGDGSTDYAVSFNFVQV